MKKILILLCLLVCGYSCVEDKKPQKMEVQVKPVTEDTKTVTEDAKHAPAQQQSSHSFEIYLTEVKKFREVGKDPYYIKAIHIDLHEVKLLEEPVISDRDIVEYDWENQTVTITAEAAARIPRPDSFGIPFVVVADGNRCYIGGFWTSLSSLRCDYPTIEVYDAKDGSFVISPAPSPTAVKAEDDPRFNQRVRDALEALGKLKTPK